MPVSAASCHSWLWFICKATEEAGEFPEAPSFCLPWYQHLANNSLTQSSFCFLAVPSHSLAYIRLGRRKEHQVQGVKALWMRAGGKSRSQKMIRSSQCGGLQKDTSVPTCLRSSVILQPLTLILLHLRLGVESGCQSRKYRYIMLELVKLSLHNI